MLSIKGTGNPEEISFDHSDLEVAENRVGHGIPIAAELFPLPKGKS